MTGSTIQRWVFRATIMAMAALLGLAASSARAQPSPCSGGGCDSRMSVSAGGSAMVGQTVDVNVDVEWAETAWDAFSAIIEYDSSVVSFVPVGTYGVGYSWACGDWTEGCHATDVPVGGDLRQTWMHNVGNHLMNSGTVAVVRYQCVGPGYTTLRLVPPTEDPWGTTTVDADGVVIPTGLTEGSITCQEPYVGGIAELAPLAGSPADETAAPTEGSGWSASSFEALAAVGVAAAAIIGVSGWYARRRWLK